MSRKFLNASVERPWKIGIVGAGGVTSGSHLPVLTNMPGVNVEWICDRSLATARSVARSYKISNAYSEISQCTDVDVVLVAVPVGARRAVVPEVLSRRWHSFCEKPFAMTLEEHDGYLADAARYGVQIGAAQLRRQGRNTMTARKLLERGVLGPILGVSAIEGNCLRRTGKGSEWYMTDSAASGGILMEMGSHLIDQLLFILGATDVSLRSCSQSTHFGHDLATSIVADVETAACTTIECGVEFSVVDDLCNGILIELPDCALKLGPNFKDLSLMSDDGKMVCELSSPEGATSAVEAFCLEWRDFLEQCRTGEPSAVDASTVRNTTALIEACHANSAEVLVG
jgi:predicted dehydrogenase